MFQLVNKISLPLICLIVSASCSPSDSEVRLSNILENTDKYKNEKIITAGYFTVNNDNYYALQISKRKKFFNKLEPYILIEDNNNIRLECVDKFVGVLGKVIFINNKYFLKLIEMDTIEEDYNNRLDCLA